MSDKCPKCGADCRSVISLVSRYHCGSWSLIGLQGRGGELVQHDKCRIRELVAEAAKLKAELINRNKAMNALRGQIARLKAERFWFDSRLTAALEERRRDDGQA